MGLTQTAPSEYPITVAEAKTHMVVAGSADDTYILSLIKAATDYAQTVQARQLIDSTFTWTLDKFPHEFVLPVNPLDSVTSIGYIDSAGSTQTLSTGVYRVDTNPDNGRIVLDYNQSWPATYDVINAVTVTFVAGYSSSGSGVPEATRQAIKILCQHWGENREPIIQGSVSDVPMSVDALLALNALPKVP